MEHAKPEIRRSLHATLRATSPGARSLWSASMRTHLLGSAAWANSATIMLFAALRFEPDFVPLVETGTGKRMLFPGLEGDRITAREVQSAEQLLTSLNGIREPSPDRCPAVPPEEIDLVIVPGLAFGPDGSRLGRGKGHYDRFLSALPDSTILCGACFVCQLLETLPAESHDIPMDAVLTENGWRSITCRHPSVP
jgi:5-formyltetrahydrofolate cyclo-ligase